MLRNFSADKKRLISNFFSLSSVEAANYVFPLITLPYLVRVLGPEKYGLINFAAAFVYYFVLLTDYGFNLSATREISVNREDKEKVIHIFNSVMFVKLVLMTVSLIIMLALIFSIPKFRQDWLIYIYTFGMVIGNILFPIWLFQGMERMKLIALLNLLAKFIFVIAIFVFVRRQADYIYVPLITSLGFMTAGVLSLIIAAKRFGMIFRLPSKVGCVQALKDGWHVFISTVSASLCTSSNAFILGLFTNNTIVGYFSAGEKIITLVNKAFNPILVAVYPHITKIAATAREIAIIKLRKLFVMIILLSFTAFIALFILSGSIVAIVLGQKFLNSVVIVRILSPLAFIVPIAYIFANLALLPFKLSKYFARIYIFGGILNIVLLLTLLYLFKAGAAGVAFSVLITQVTITTLMYIVLRRHDIKIVNMDVSSLLAVFEKKAIINN